MAILAKMTARLRRKVGDWRNPEDPDAEYVYAEAYYEDAVNDALCRFLGDTNLSYTLATLPAKYEWIVLLLGQIEVLTLLILDSQDATSGESLGNVQRVQVPDLETWFHTPRGATGGDWVKLRRDLEETYQDWLKDNGFDREVDNDLPEIVSYTVQRENLRRGRAWSHPELDRGLAAVTGFEPAISDTGVFLTWEPIYHTQFKYYQIQRRLVSQEWEDATIVANLYDNHRYEYTDTTSLSAGTYVYRVLTVNKNGLKTPCTEGEVEVT